MKWISYVARSAMAAGVVFSLAGCVMVKDPVAEGNRLVKQERYLEAAAEYDRAIKRNPNDYKTHVAFGDLREKQGQMEQAVNCYVTALKVMNNTTEGKRDTAYRMKLYTMITERVSKNDPSEVRLKGWMVDAEKKRDADAAYLVARTYAARKDLDSALKYYQLASLMNSNSTLYQRDYALCLFNLKNPKAKPELYRYRDLDKDNDEVNAALRSLGEKIGDEPLPKKTPPKPVTKA